MWKCGDEEAQNQKRPGGRRALGGREITWLELFSFLPSPNIYGLTVAFVPGAVRRSRDKEKTCSHGV